MKIVRFDNDPEFGMTDFYSIKGIIHQTSCVETPQHNGLVEHKHQDLLNVTRALLSQARLHALFWCYAIEHVAYLINYIPTPLLHNLSPH